MIVGIDIGGTTTKIVGFRDCVPVDYLTVTASDPLTSAAGGLGRFLTANRLPIGSVERLVMTGAGSAAIDSDLLGIPTSRVDEIRAIGLGGLYVSGLRQAVVVSMGTGTAIVKASGSNVVHLGGTGVGGGTLLGLSRLILNTDEFSTIDSLSVSGSLAPVDLTVGDLYRTSVGVLPPDITASNFGKLEDQASRSDLALGIVNLVLQVIAQMAVFAARIYADHDVVLTGMLVHLSRAREITRQVGELFGVTFRFPERADYATAVGAALTALEPAAGAAQ